jgi:hypothetical protein
MTKPSGIPFFFDPIKNPKFSDDFYLALSIIKTHPSFLNIPAEFCLPAKNNSTFLLIVDNRSHQGVRYGIVEHVAVTVD